MRTLYFAAAVSSFYFFSLPILSSRTLDVCHTSTHDVALVLHLILKSDILHHC